MAAFHHFWILALFLVAVLGASSAASSRQSYDGRQVSDDLSSLPAARKLLDSTSIGKISELNGGPWCVSKDGAPEDKLKGNLDFACSHGGDCNPIQSGGSCFEPDTLKSHASYAMNSYFQTNSKDTQSCDFGGTGTVTHNNPSYGKCNYPG